MKLSESVEHIRNKSDPQKDQQEAVKANARLLDALYRLSFTADKLKPVEIDELVNSLQRKENEVKVLLGRIKNVYKKGFSISLFSDTKPKSV